MRRWWWVAIPVAGVLLVASSAAAAPKAVWKDPGAPERIRAYVTEVEARTGPWPGLADFLVAVAYWESRGDANAVRSTGERGLFQMRDDSRCLRAMDLTADELLGRERLQVLMAACHVAVLGMAYTASPVDWLAIRRGWKVPTLVDDFAETQLASRRIRSRFSLALRTLELPTTLMRERVFPRTGFEWPGIETILGAV